MAVSEQRRHHLYQKLEELLGADHAGTLMEHLPPSGWSDVATKADLQHLAAATKADVEHLAAATQAEMQHHVVQLGARIDAVEAGLGARIDAVEAGLGARIEAMQLKISEQLGRELGSVYRELAAHTRTITFACLGAVMTSAGLAFAAARL